jgi:hypothetical protein
MLYIKRSWLKTLLGGWMDGWVAGKAGLRIAYSNQQSELDQYILKVHIKMVLLHIHIVVKGFATCLVGSSIIDQYNVC